MSDHEVEVPLMGLGMAAAMLVDVAGGQGYEVTAAGPNRFHLARTSRPWWANVLALLFAPLIGIGLLFLRVRRTESCDAIILEARGGVRINLGALDDPALFLALHRAVSEHAPAAPPPPRTTAYAPGPAAPSSPVAPPPAVAPSLPSTWSAPAPASAAPPEFDRTLTIAQLAAMRSRAAPELRLPDGRRIPVGAGVVIGRDPDVHDELPSAELLALREASISKTHASFGPTPHGLWVQDHGSTNGTTVVVGGSATRCQPGAKVNVPIGGVVVLGEVRVEIVGART